MQSIEAEAAKHRRELAAMPGLRADAILADDAVAAIAALKAREEELYGALEVGEMQLTRLREKLRERVNVRRLDRIEFHRRQAAERFEALAAALNAAVEANEAASAAFAAASAELGGGDAMLLVGQVDYLVPGAVIRDMVQFWHKATRSNLAASIARAPKVPTAPNVPSSPAFHDPARSFGANDAEWAKRFVPPAITTPTPSRQTSDTRPARVASPPPAPSSPPPLQLPDPGPDGRMKVTVLRSGFTSADGNQHKAGAVLDLPYKEAEAAIRGGAADTISISK
jgi:hypothetical protein